MYVNKDPGYSNKMIHEKKHQYVCILHRRDCEV